MKNSATSKIKYYDNIFNNLSTKGRFVVVGILFLLLFLVVNISSHIYTEITLRIEASKYDITPHALISLKSEALQQNMSLDKYLLEKKKANSLGFNEFNEYLSSKEFGVVTSEEFSFINKLGRSKEEWALDKEKIKTSGVGIHQYFAQVQDEKRKKQDEENKNLAKKLEWENRCERFSVAKNECAVAASVSKCVETKLGYLELEMGRTYCNGNKPNWFLMGERWN